MAEVPEDWAAQSERDTAMQAEMRLVHRGLRRAIKAYARSIGATVQVVPGTEILGRYYIRLRPRPGSDGHSDAPGPRPPPSRMMAVVRVGTRQHVRDHDGWAMNERYASERLHLQWFVDGGRETRTHSYETVPPRAEVKAWFLEELRRRVVHPDSPA